MYRPAFTRYSQSMGNVMSASRRRAAFDRVRAARDAAMAARRPAGPTLATRRAILSRQLVGVESKFYDTFLTSTALVASSDCSGCEFDPSATSMISTPAQGDGEQNRDGKKIIITSVEVKGTVNFPVLINQTTAGIPYTYMVALVQDTQTNGAQLNSEDVYKNAVGINQANTFPLRNLLYSTRFRVLAVQKGAVPQPLPAYDGTNIELSGSVIPFDFYKKVNIPVNFNATTTSTVAAVVDNSLHVIAFVSSVAQAPTIQYQARIRFQG